MSFENLKIPKRVKKKKLIDKIKNKNRSNISDNENFKEKVSLFNKQLNFVFSESEEDEKKNMIAYTSILNKDELDTFIDEEGKERMEMDWPSGEFSDSDEEIYTEPDTVIKKNKWKDKFLRKRKINLGTENLTPNLADEKKNKLPIKKWKKTAIKFFKKSKKGSPDDTASIKTDEIKESIYEKIEQPRLYGKKEEPIYEEIQYNEQPRLYDKKEETKYATTKQQITPLDADKIPLPPPLPSLSTMPTKKRRASISPEKGSSGSTGFTPQFINQRELTYDEYRTARDVLKKDEAKKLFDFNQIDQKSENIEIKRRKLTNLKDDKLKKATFLTFKSPKKDNVLNDKKIAKIGRIGKMDRKTF